MSALDELAKQLRFAPPETLRRQLDRTEELAGEIDPSRNYPEDWLVFRITGYRPQIESPALVVGEALLGDLSALAERLSAAAGLGEGELNGGRFLTMPQLRKRWAVSGKTLERYRRLGLVARRVAGPGTGVGRVRLVFSLAGVERFEKERKERLDGAAAYSRIGPALRERIVREGAGYRRKLGWSLNRAARRLATRHGRGHETVRQLLKRHDQRGGQPVFGDPGPPGERERRLIERAYRRAVEPGEIADHLDRSKAAVQRVINDSRGERLRFLLARDEALAPTAPRADSGPVDPKRGAEAADAELGFRAPLDLLELIVAARAVPAITPTTERTLVARYRALLDRAAGAIRTLPAHGAPAGTLDRIETDLRWAARVKAVLVRSQLPLLVRTLEATLGRPLEEVRGGRLAALVAGSLAAIVAAVDAYEPAKGGRLAGPAGLAITRLATREVRERGDAPAPGRGRATASSRLGPGHPIPDWTRRIAPWQSWEGRAWLETEATVQRGGAQLPERLRMVLAMRQGWGRRPLTLAEAARELRTTPMAAARMERRAVREARELGAGL